MYNLNFLGFLCCIRKLQSESWSKCHVFYFTVIFGLIYIFIQQDGTPLVVCPALNHLRAALNNATPAFGGEDGVL